MRRRDHRLRDPRLRANRLGNHRVRALVCAGLSLALVTLPGCTPTPPTPTATDAVVEPGRSPGPDRSPESEESSTPPPELSATASAAEVRERGVALEVGTPGRRGTSVGPGGVFWTALDAQSLAVQESQGWSAYTVAVQALPTGRTTIALFAAPEQATFEVLLDGSAVVRDVRGLALAGLTAPVAAPASAGSSVRYEAGGPGVLRLVVAEPPATGEDTDAAVEVSFSPSDWAVTTLDWGEREGGRSLAVAPNDWARSGGEAALEVAWSEIVEREPEADVPGMYDQLACHALGAPDKETWNLEPWRPAVGLLGTLAARCNP